MNQAFVLRFSPIDLGKNFLSYFVYFSSKGIVLVTDAIAAMGLQPGTYQLGQQLVSISGFSARVVDTNVLAGR